MDFGKHPKIAAEIHAYNWVNLDFANGCGRVYLRCWSDRLVAWREDIDAHVGGQFPLNSLPKNLAARLPPGDEKDRVAHKEQTPATSPEAAWDIEIQGAPYLGLQAMTEKHTAVFFGRKAQLKQLKEKLDQQRFVVVVGASGAGKSSLVWAGLIPKLEAWQVGGFGRWDWLRMTPAEKKHCDPLRRLADVLARKLALDSGDIELALQSDGMEWQALTQEARQLADQWLLFIDQFEDSRQGRAGFCPGHRLLRTGSSS